MIHAEKVKLQLTIMFMVDGGWPAGQKLAVVGVELSGVSIVNHEPACCSETFHCI